MGRMRVPLDLIDPGTRRAEVGSSLPPMKRVLVVLAAVLLLAGAAAAVLLVVAGGEEQPEFTEAEAEAAVSRALERCKHNLRDARRVNCEAVVNGFACRADGRFVAGFEEPDPERPEFSVVC
jgi:hypothetical protein